MVARGDSATRPKFRNGAQRVLPDGDRHEAVDADAAAVLRAAAAWRYHTHAESRPVELNFAAARHSTISARRRRGFDPTVHSSGSYLQLDDSAGRQTLSAPGIDGQSGDLVTWRPLPSRSLTLDHDPYAAWAETYPPSAHNPLMEVEEAAVLALVPAVAGLTVLDAGCGTGRYARLLTARGARQVVGVDLSPAMLARAAAEMNRIRGRLERLPFASRSFDLIVSGLALPDVDRLEPVVSEWSRVLVPAGCCRELDAAPARRITGLGAHVRYPVWTAGPAGSLAFD